MNTWKKGQVVRHIATNVEGRIIRIKGSNALIEGDSHRFWSAIANLEIIDVPYNPISISSKVSVSFKSDNLYRNLIFEIDLHGYNVEQALEVLDKFIDRGVVNRQSSLKIIHGKGTGILRNAVINFLKNDPRVINVITNHILLGGSGVTLIDI